MQFIKTGDKNNMKTSIKTTDLDLAASLLAHGGKLSDNGPWRIVRTGKKKTVEFAFDNVETEWIDQFRSGADGRLAFIAARGMLLKIISTLDINKDGVQHGKESGHNTAVEGD